MAVGADDMDGNGNTRRKRRSKWDMPAEVNDNKDIENTTSVKKSRFSDASSSEIDRPVDAAQKAKERAAQLAAKLAAEGKINSTPPPPLIATPVGTPADQFKPGAPPPPVSIPAYNQTWKPDVKKLDGGGYIAEFDINDIPARVVLTKGAVQEQINQQCGVAVSTRGRYLSPDEKQLIKMPDSGVMSLHLCIQAPIAAKVEVALHKIQDIIKNYDKKQSTTGPNAPLTALFGESNHPPPGMHFVQDKVFVGLEHAVPEFNVKAKVEGPGGSFLQHIASQTGAKVYLRGKGSGYIEPTSGKESFEALYIYVNHAHRTGLDEAKQLCRSLIEKVQNDHVIWEQNRQKQPSQTPGYWMNSAAYPGQAAGYQQPLRYPHFPQGPRDVAQPFRYGQPPPTGPPSGHSPARFMPPHQDSRTPQGLGHLRAHESGHSGDNIQQQLPSSDAGFPINQPSHRQGLDQGSDFTKQPNTVPEGQTFKINQSQFNSSFQDRQQDIHTPTVRSGAQVPPNFSSYQNQPPPPNQWPPVPPAKQDNTSAVLPPHSYQAQSFYPPGQDSQIPPSRMPTHLGPPPLGSGPPFPPVPPPGFPPLPPQHFPLPQNSESFPNCQGMRTPFPSNNQFPPIPPGYPALPASHPPPPLYPPTTIGLPSNSQLGSATSGELTGDLQSVPNMHNQVSSHENTTEINVSQTSEESAIPPSSKLSTINSSTEQPRRRFKEDPGLGKNISSADGLKESTSHSLDSATKFRSPPNISSQHNSMGRISEFQVPVNAPKRVSGKLPSTPVSGKTSSSSDFKVPSLSTSLKAKVGKVTGENASLAKSGALCSLVSYGTGSDSEESDED